MDRLELTGSRIRQARLSKGMRQAELARQVGISASYLNLIEHNRRRIGGKLLVEIARSLAMEVTLLSQGVHSTILQALDRTASNYPDIAPEVDRGQELAGRFPGWAAVIEAQQAKNQALERTVETLLNRLTHDPQLAATMHEMLSVITAIRSTSAILADTTNLDSEWQTRFHRNLYEDSQRLAQNAQTLVAHLDATDEGQSAADPTLPKEELESWLAGRGYHLPELEGQTDPDIAKFLAAESQLTTSKTTALYSAEYLQRYRADAVAIPKRDLLAEIASAEIIPQDFDPLRLAHQFATDLATVLRRVASLDGQEFETSGLVICDSSGTLTFCKPLDGFPLPRFGAACPLWPLYQALSHPMTPLCTPVKQSGHQSKNFMTYAVALPVTKPDFTVPPLYEATMLILSAPETAQAQPVGTSCRICPRQDCRGRREPSILTSGF